MRFTATSLAVRLLVVPALAVTLTVMAVGFFAPEVLSSEYVDGVRVVHNTLAPEGAR